MTIGERFLTIFLQSWGHPVEKKIAVLNDAVAAAGINATFIQEEKDGEIVAGWECETLEDGERASQLHKELITGWCLGEYQAEAARADNIIRKYTKAA